MCEGGAGLRCKICESDAADRFGKMRRAVPVGSWIGGDVYRLQENGHIAIRRELSPGLGVVRWVTASQWPSGYVEGLSFKDGLMIDILDSAGRVVATEFTYHSRWNGGGLADKELPFSWEK